MRHVAEESAALAARGLPCRPARFVRVARRSVLGEAKACSDLWVSIEDVAARAATSGTVSERTVSIHLQAAETGLPPAAVIASAERRAVAASPAAAAGFVAG